MPDKKVISFLLSTVSTAPFSAARRAGQVEEVALPAGGKLPARAIILDSACEADLL